MVLSPRVDLLPKPYSTTSNLFFSHLTSKRRGEIAGIVQIPAEIAHFKINSVKKTVGSDYADDFEHVADTFNSYVNPEVLSEYWDQRSISVHGILPDDERIKNTGNMKTKNRYLSFRTTKLDRVMV